MSDDLPVNEPMNGMQDQAVDTTHGEAIQEQAWEPSQIAAGQQLRSLREARGWTESQVANQLNLAARQIEALEQDNYAALPGMVIVRGFIRSYAKVLQVDAAPILAAINGGNVEPNVLPRARSEMSASFSETQLLSSQPRRRSFLKLVFSLIVLLLLAMGALWLAQRMHWLPKKLLLSSAQIESELTRVSLNRHVVLTPAATVAETAAASRVASPAIKKPQSSEQSSAHLSEKTAPAKSAAKPLASVPPAVAVVTPAVSSSSNTVKSDSSSTVSASGKNALAIVAHEDSWLEIRQADDTIMVSHILQAGSSEVFNITKPVSMIIGNAAGVKVTFRGKSLDVMSGNSSNVARLNLK